MSHRWGPSYDPDYSSCLECGYTCLNGERQAGHKEVPCTAERRREYREQMAVFKKWPRSKVTPNTPAAGTERRMER